MAREGYPAAALIASGQVEKLMRGIDTARLFPDYSKLYAVKMPDISGVAIAALPNVSKSVLGSLPDLSKVALTAVPNVSRIVTQTPDLSKLVVGIDVSKLVQDYGRVLGAAALPNMSRLVSSLTLAPTFPDYSRLFATLDNVAVRREYVAAMPAAAEAAESLLIEEVLTELEPSITREEVWGRVKTLSSEQRRALAERVAVAIGLIVGIAGVAMESAHVEAAGMLLALAAALYAIHVVIKIDDDPPS